MYRTRFTGGLTALALAAGAALFSPHTAEAQEVSILGGAMACFAGQCGTLGFEEEQDYVTPEGVTLQYRSAPAVDFFGETVMGELGIQGGDWTNNPLSGSGSFGFLRALTVSPAVALAPVPFELLLTFYNPTLIGSDPIFTATLTGSIGTAAGTGRLAWNFDPEVLGPYPFTQLAGPSGELLVGIYDDNTPTGEFGAITGYVQVQNVVPEPTSMLLLGTGLAGLAGMARRRRRRDDVE